MSWEKFANIVVLLKMMRCAALTEASSMVSSDKLEVFEHKAEEIQYTMNQRLFDLLDLMPAEIAKKIDERISHDTNMSNINSGYIATFYTLITETIEALVKEIKEENT